MSIRALCRLIACCMGFLIIGMAGKAEAQCFRSSITSPAPFLGNHDEIFQLSDGSYWRVQHEYSYLYEYYPNVVVCPDRMLLIVGDRTLNVAPIVSAPGDPNEERAVVESRIDGQFEGFEFGRVYLLQNGQVWRQTSARIRLRLRLSPRVLIVPTASGFEMTVEGVEGGVRVERLR
jgi:hypothetical protein